MRRNSRVHGDRVRRRATWLNGRFRRGPPRRRGPDRHPVLPQHRVARRQCARANLHPRAPRRRLRGTHPSRKRLRLRDRTRRHRGSLCRHGRTPRDQVARAGGDGLNKRARRSLPARWWALVVGVAGAHGEPAVGWPAVALAFAGATYYVDMGKVLSKEELEAAHCWEAGDRVPGRPEMTEFRRRLRYHQSQWREAEGHPIGSQPIAPKPGGGAVRLVGSRLPLAYARETGANFLTAGALDAARARTSIVEPHQSFDHQRLWADL